MSLEGVVVRLLVDDDVVEAFLLGFFLPMLDVNVFLMNNLFVELMEMEPELFSID